MYVDDELVTGNKDEEFEVFQGLQQEGFKITIGSLEKFLEPLSDERTESF
jgi:hypothetical protein